MSTIKVSLEGRGTATIRPSSHLATGGEGSAYKLNDTVVKIYTDPSRMLQDDMAGKILCLSRMKHKSIIAPEGLVSDLKGTPIGFYMPHVSGESITRVFTNDFRARANFGDKQASEVSEKMRDAMSYAHSQNALMIDANELNWLVELSSEMTPYVIDVDSWAIDKWKPTAIMPSIRDWSTATFNELTDWFAWGIVTFQIYTGIHPYKGTMPNFKRGDMEGRMKASASVFDPGVRLNSAVRDFSCIPVNLAQWYEAVFQHGERSLPPSPLASPIAAKAARTMRKIITSSGNLTYRKMLSSPSDSVIKIFPCGTALFKSGAVIDIASQREIITNASLNSEIIRTDTGWLIASTNNGSAQFNFVNAVSYEKVPLNPSFDSKAILRANNRLLSVNESGLSGITMTRLGAGLAIAQTWGVMIQSTSWFEGLGIMDSIGANYLILPFGDKSCAHVRVKELDGMKAVNATSGNRFATVIAADSSGKLHKQEYWFANDYKSYSFYSSKVDITELNIAIMDKGVCASIIDDGELVVFVPSSGTVNKIKDKNISTSMQIASTDAGVMLSDGGDIWHIKTA